MFKFNANLLKSQRNTSTMKRDSLEHKSKVRNARVMFIKGQHAMPVKIDYFASITGSYFMLIKIPTLHELVSLQREVKNLVSKGLCLD